MSESLTPFEALGGEDKLSELVDIFYRNVSEDPLLHPVFPDHLGETARKQKQFLTQFLGGPALYTEEHGHPMLRARHMPFEITPARAEAWLSCMDRAMDEAEVEDPVREHIFTRLSYTAKHMVNTPEE